MATVTIDNRGLQPPEPLVRILAEVEGLEPGNTLHALMDREPVMLFPELQRRGFAWSCEPDGPGYLVAVWHEADA